jgi:O-succinylbenzoate synthase
MTERRVNNPSKTDEMHSVVRDNPPRCTGSVDELLSIMVDVSGNKVQSVAIGTRAGISYQHWHLIVRMHEQIAAESRRYS